MNENLEVLIRCDGSEHAGLGHVTRSCVLGQALQEMGARVLVAITARDRRCESLVQSRGLETISVERSGHVTESPDAQRQDAIGVLEALDHNGLTPQVVIADHYGLSAEWEEIMGAQVRRVVSIDDEPGRVHSCHVLVDQNASVELVGDYQRFTSPGCRLLLGGKFALLASEYARIREVSRSTRNSVDRVVINFGGVDQPELMKMASETVRATFGHSVTLRQITQSDGLQSLAEEFQEADLAIGAAGSSSWERVCLGLPSIVMPIAKNQVAVAEALDRRGLAISIGFPGPHSQVQLRAALRRLSGAGALAAMATTCRSSEVDGLGATRVGLAVVSEVAELMMRPVTPMDTERLLDWRNDSLVVANSQSGRSIDKKSHVRWLTDVLARPDMHHWLIAMAGGQTAVGQVRFDLRESRWWMTYSIDRRFRGLGLGASLIRAGLRSIENRSSPRTVSALVRASNEASRKTLLRVGFVPILASSSQPSHGLALPAEMEEFSFDMSRDV